KSTTYYVGYQFQAAAPGQPLKTYQNRQSVSYAAYNRHPQGSTVNVAYLPNDPNMSRLGGPDRDQASMWIVLPFLVIMILFPAGFFVYTIRKILQDRALANQGHIIEGELIERQGAMVGSKSRYYK